MGRRMTWWLAMVAAGVIVSATNHVIAAVPTIDQSTVASPGTVQVQPAASDDLDMNNENATPIEVAAGSPADPASTLGTVASWIIMVTGLGTVVVFFGRRWYQLRGAPRQPRAFEPEVGLGLVVLMFILGRIGLGAAQSMAGIVETEGGTPPELTVPQTVILTLALYAAQLIVLAAYIWFRYRTPAPRPDQRWPVPMAAMAAAAISPLVLAAVWVAGSAAGWLLGAPPDEIAHDTLRDMVEAPWDGWTLLLAALVTLAAPLFEELMYRGLLQRSIINAGFPRWLAIVAASLVFTLLHVGVVATHALASLLVLSLTLGWLYERTGRLTAPVVLHALFNAANLFLAKLTAG